MRTDWSSASWRKSSYSSGNGNCTLVAKQDGIVGVRDSKLGDDSPTLEFTQGEWVAFLAGARNGEFDN